MAAACRSPAARPAPRQGKVPPLRKVNTQVLIVGAGGAGLAMTCYLQDLGVDTITVERHAGTSPMPKAHYINQRTMEVFRQHGMSEAVYARAAPRENLQHIRWMTSLGGDGPLDRIKYVCRPIMGGGELTPIYDAKGVTHPTNIPQIRLEPVLVDLVETRRPGAIKFRHELVSFTQDDDGVTALVRDLTADEELEIRCDYLIGADAGKTVGPALGVRMLGATGVADVYTIWFSADLSQYLDDDDTPMRRIFHPADPTRVQTLLTFGPTRFDRHSEEWASTFTLGSQMSRRDDHYTVPDEYLVKHVFDTFKVDVPRTVHKITRWQLETVNADRFAVGRVFLIGDAAHKHPPSAGLGLNSGFQDGHNLAWKIALVLRGLAGLTLLETYGTERQPVIAHNTEWAMNASTNVFILMAAIGAIPGEPPEQTCKRFEVLVSDTRLGATRRAQLDEIFRIQRVEYAAHDMEMGFTYDHGAVVDDGSPPAWRDPMGHDYRPTSRPGSRLPHAWLDRGGETLSSHDLIPLGGFALITGPDGQDWCDAAAALSAETGVEIAASRVGEGCPVTDPSGAWAAVREIGEAGCLLVRPDGHVAYRSMDRAPDARAALAAALAQVLHPAAAGP